MNDEEPDPVVVPIEDEIDLHFFRPRDVRSVVESYLEQAVELGLGEVRLIHGKGIGELRKQVRRLLEKHPDVESFEDGGLGGGDWGATVARLRPKRRRD